MLSVVGMASYQVCIFWWLVFLLNVGHWLHLFSSSTTCCYALLTHPPLETPLPVQLPDLYPTDPFFGKVWTDALLGNSDEYVLVDGFLFCGNQICIPEGSLHLHVIRELQSEGHIGRDHTLQLVASFYFWPFLRRDVERFIVHCEICQSAKGHASNARLYLPLPIPLSLVHTLAWTSFLASLAHNVAMIQSSLWSTDFQKWYILCRLKRQQMGSK